MRVVIQEVDFEFVFETETIPFDGSEEAFEKRSDILDLELKKRHYPRPPEGGRDYYVDKVTPLPGDAELWGLGT